MRCVAGDRENELRRRPAQSAQSRRARAADHLRRRQPANHDPHHRLTMAPGTHKLLRRLDAEDGFTLIEVLIAAVIPALASLAVFGVLTAATRNAARAQATQVALDKAQEEMEKLHALPYSELALERLPQYE